MSTRDCPQHVFKSDSHTNDKEKNRANSKLDDHSVSSGHETDRRGRPGHGGPHRKFKSSSPKHLLYQVLLSPIKKKVTHHKHELMVRST